MLWKVPQCLSKTWTRSEEVLNLLPSKVRSRNGRNAPGAKTGHANAWVALTSANPQFASDSGLAGMLAVSEKSIRRFLLRGLLHSSKASRKKSYNL